MKRIFIIILYVLFLFGCDNNSQLDQAISIREKLLTDSCAFCCDVTADYADTVYSFSLQCDFTKDGALRFTVLEPETIYGIAGNITATGGQLHYEDQYLAFPLLADGYISPVSAPWIMIKSLRGGYIRACGKVDNGLRITLDDSFLQEPLQLEVWTSEEGNPEFCEVIWKGRRILSVSVTEFDYV